MDSYYLAHHGIKGQHWGNRRWQYTNGSLTPDGYIHYGVGQRLSKKLADHAIKNDSKRLKKYEDKKERIASRLKNSKQSRDKIESEYLNQKNVVRETQRQLSKSQYGLEAKLLGQNPRRVRKLKEKLSDQLNKLGSIEYDLDEARDYVRACELSYEEVSANLDRVSFYANNRTNDYINKYGQEEYNNVMKKHEMAVKSGADFDGDIVKK